MFKLDNGSELFPLQGMRRLRKNVSGTLGTWSWAEKKDPQTSTSAALGAAFPDQGEEIGALRLEVPAELLMQLLAGGHVGAADLRCLDTASQACLRRLCLQSCLVKNNAANSLSRTDAARSGA